MIDWKSHIDRIPIDLWEACDYATRFAFLKWQIPSMEVEDYFFALRDLRRFLDGNVHNGLLDFPT